jgi:hypothetical protein
MTCRAISAWLICTIVWLGATTRADVVPIGPFQGTMSENFDNLNLGVTNQQISVFGGTTTVTNLTNGGALKLAFGSTLGGVTVTARSAPTMLGELGITSWVFSTPLSKFGGYWQNNSRFDDAQVAFYDVAGNLLATETATDPHATPNWTWNGWQSSVPVAKLVITGNDTEFFNGFIWLDDMQATPGAPAVPEPSTFALAGVGVSCLGLISWRRRRRAR